jgi:hypothetical protein
MIIQSNWQMKMTMEFINNEKPVQLISVQGMPPEIREILSGIGKAWMLKVK